MGAASFFIVAKRYKRYSGQQEIAPKKNAVAYWA